jgi:hypothetical protein
MTTRAPGPFVLSLPQALTAPIVPRSDVLVALGGLTVALLLGTAVRVGYVLPVDFPLADGGLFYTMVEDLQRAHFILPVTTTYNGAGLPYAYPPLAFYIAGLLATIGPWALIDLFRWLPLLFSVLTIPAFWLLARALLPDTRAATFATVAFALLPLPLFGVLAGGGLTRGLGLLFVLLALWQAHHLYTRPCARTLVGTTLACTGAVLSHPAMAWLAILSIAVFWLLLARSRGAALYSALVVGCTLLLTAPWWGTVLVRHGPEAYLAAARSGTGPIGLILLLPLLLPTTALPVFPALAALAVMGLVVAVADGRFLLPVWRGVSLLLEQRQGVHDAAIPIALLAGVGGTVGLQALLHRGAAPSRRAALSGPLIGIACLQATLVAALDVRSSLQPIGAPDRAVMAWIALHTDPDSRFLVLPVIRGGVNDPVADWFPALVERVSVATVQGTEWAPPGTYARRLAEWRMLSDCEAEGGSCLDSWRQKTGLPFTHIFMPSTTFYETNMGALQHALAHDSRYRQVYAVRDAVLFEYLGD